MITYLKGVLAEKKLAEVTVDVQGVGYAVEIPLSTYEALPQLEEEVKILTHHHIREDTQKLFGFHTHDERELFRLLLSVNKIGPKVALNILSKVSISDLAQAINLGDAGKLKSVPGIGPKTAQRLVIELKGKFSGGDPGGQNPVATPVSPTSLYTSSSVKDDACQALIQLGYTEKLVAPAVERVAETISADAPIEEWIKRALQVI